ncbi:uncharacterized protein LY89DRAFT_155558 [Mollisia scopiformis]|uniref:Uncharacterized protein n=1 Tax=Mollisia scopiformis TaxID=149040 RepID=A0A194WZ96_MOLSC|nr:uncharacterized protein LY89DRAFT_155558 [Mollisia scopiformis]KUJ13270.1 hypothetical protein LY89DRAFT_155558 [Mollisia scopiformis]
MHELFVWFPSTKCQLFKVVFFQLQLIIILVSWSLVNTQRVYLICLPFLPTA